MFSKALREICTHYNGASLDDRLYSPATTVYHIHLPFHQISHPLSQRLCKRSLLLTKPTPASFKHMYKKPPLALFSLRNIFRSISIPDCVRAAGHHSWRRLIHSCTQGLVGNKEIVKWRRPKDAGAPEVKCSKRAEP